MKRLFLFILLTALLYAGKATAAGEASGFIQAGKLHIHYTRQGSGRPMVLLHAGYQDMGMWEKQLTYFSPHYTVICLDLPGHGATTGMDTTLLIQEVLRICFDSMHLGKAVVMGLSLGAACATDFALAYPERVEKLILAASGLSGWGQVMKIDSLSARCFDIQDSVSATGNKEAMAAVIVRNWAVGPFRPQTAVNRYTVHYVYNTTLHNLRRHMGTSGWPRFARPEAALRMSGLRPPLLLIAGDADMPLIRQEAHWMHQVVKGSREVVFPHVAHMVNLEVPDAFNRAVDDFLR